MPGPISDSYKAPTDGGFVSAECDECGDMILRRADEKACPKCSGYFHKGDCYHNHVEKQHRY